MMMIVVAEVFCLFYRKAHTALAQYQHACVQLFACVHSLSGGNGDGNSGSVGGCIQQVVVFTMVVVVFTMGVVIFTMVVVVITIVVMVLIVLQRFSGNYSNVLGYLRPSASVVYTAVYCFLLLPSFSCIWSGCDIDCCGSDDKGDVCGGCGGG